MAEVHSIGTAEHVHRPHLEFHHVYRRRLALRIDGLPEMFILGNRDLRLPGLGSYLQSASNAGATRSIVWGLIVMILVIVFIDQILWRPLICSVKLRSRLEADRSFGDARFSGIKLSAQVASAFLDL